MIDVFLRIFLTNPKLSCLKSDVSCEASIFMTPHKMTRLPRNLHLVATWRGPDNAIRKNTQHDTSKVLRLPRDMTMEVTKVLRLPRKMQHIFWKRCQSIVPATQDEFWHAMKHVEMSPSATPATWNEARRRLKPTKVTTFAELAIGTAIRTSQGHLRTVVDGCERLRTVAQRRANTPSTPRPPEWSGNPCYAFGKNVFSRIEYPCLGSSVSMVSAEFQVTQADAGGGPFTSHKSSMPSSDWSEVDVEFLIFLTRSSQCRKQTDSC